MTAVYIHIYHATYDVDIILHLREKDFIAAQKALLEIGLVCKIPLDAETLFRFREDYIQNRNLLAWSF